MQLAKLMLIHHIRRANHQLLRALLEELSPSQAAKVAARLTGEKRGELYQKAMAMK